MVGKPTIGQTGWGALLNDALDDLDIRKIDTDAARANLPINVVSEYGTTWAMVAEAATDAATQGRPLYLPGRTWTADTTLTLATGLSVLGDPGLTVVQHAFDAPLFSAAGTLGSVVAITVASAVGASTLTVASTAGLAADDVVIMRDTSQPFLAGSGKTQEAVVGEVMRVKSVNSATSVTLRGRLEFAYTTSADIRKISTVRDVGLNGLRLVNTTPNGRSILARGLVATYVRNLRVQNVEMVDYDAVGLYLQSVYDFHLSDLSFQDFHDETGNAPYCIIAAGSTCHGMIRGVRARNGRHVFTTGASSTLPVPAHIRISGGVASEFAEAAWDTHPGSRFITFEDCETYGGAAHGFQIRGTDSAVLNPTVSQHGGYGVYASFGADRLVVRGGRLAGCDVGVRLDALNDATIKNLRIDSPRTAGISTAETSASWTNYFTQLDLDDIAVTGNPSTAAFDFSGRWSDQFRLGDLRALDATTPVLGGVTTPTLLGTSQDGFKGGISPSIGPATQASLTLVASTAYLGRFVPARNMLVDTLSFAVTTAAAADDAVDVGIYSLNASSNVLTRLVSSGATTGKLNSAGVKTVSITPTRLVAGTVYYVAFAAGTFGGAAAVVSASGMNNSTASAIMGSIPPNLIAGSKAATYPLSATINGPSATGNAPKMGLLTP